MVTTGPKISSRFVRHETGRSGDHRWFEKVSVATSIIDRFRGFAAKRDLASLFLREIDIELYLIELSLAHDRALFGLVVEWIATF